jgi:hypothetical protein
MHVSPIKRIFPDEGDYLSFASELLVKLGLFDSFSWDEDSDYENKEIYHARNSMLPEMIKYYTFLRKRNPTLHSLPTSSIGFVIPYLFEETFEVYDPSTESNARVASLPKLISELRSINAYNVAWCRITLDTIPRCDGTLDGVLATIPTIDFFIWNPSSARALYTFGMIYRVAKEAQDHNLPMIIW